MVHHSRHLEGSPEQVLAALNDPELIVEWVTRLKSVSHEWRTDHKELPRTELRFSSDMSRVPPPISTFVGDTLDVIDRRSWRRAGSGAGFVTDLDVAALTAGKGGVLAGSLLVAREGAGSSIMMDGDLRLSGVPRMLARTLRGQVEVLVVNVLIEQLDLAQERLKRA